MWVRLLLTSLILLIFSLLLTLTANDLLRSRQPNIILLTVESLRRDLLNQAAAPSLLKAADDALVFNNHHAVSGWTGTNIISLLTGLSPFQSGVHTRGQSVDPDLYLPLEQLRDDGYIVAGLQGFMTMDIYKNFGLEIIDPGIDFFYWLAQRKNDRAEKPFVVWRHYLHTHLPYRTDNKKNCLDPQPEDPGLKQRLAAVATEPAIIAGSVDFQSSDFPWVHDMHTCSVLEFDDWFREFFDFFNKSGLSDNTVLIVTADHGDEHAERGNVGHASTTHAGHLHREIVQVPLIIWLPDRLKTGETGFIDKITSHLDIMPTILALLNKKPALDFSGRNLLGASNGKSANTWSGMTSGAGFSEADPDKIGFFMYGYQKDNWKFLLRKSAADNESFQLFDVRQDPEELIDLSTIRTGKINELKSALRPLIAGQVNRPVSQATDMATVTGNFTPRWITPGKGGIYDYDKLQGSFCLEWSGEGNELYIVQYKAGLGARKIEGEIEVQGTRKDFGKISRRYWNTWIVPYSPFTIRVARAGGSDWSSWLTIEAVQ